MLSWEEKFAYDVQYVDTRCLRVDLRILLETVVKVIRREGISAEGHTTSPEFLGTTASRPDGTRPMVTGSEQAGVNATHPRIGRPDRAEPSGHRYPRMSHRSPQEPPLSRPS